MLYITDLVILEKFSQKRRQLGAVLAMLLAADI